MLLGLVESLGAAFISSPYQNVYGFVLVLLILVLTARTACSASADGRRDGRGCSKPIGLTKRYGGLRRPTTCRMSSTRARSAA